MKCKFSDTNQQFQMAGKSLNFCAKWPQLPKNTSDVAAGVTRPTPSSQNLQRGRICIIARIEWNGCELELG